MERVSPGAAVVVQLVGYVVLDRVRDNLDPADGAHGVTVCRGCGAWCWLGDSTHGLITPGVHRPLCAVCAKTFGRADTPGS